MTQQEQRAQLLAGLYCLALTVGVVSGGSLAACGIGGALLWAGLVCWQERRWPWPDKMALGFGLSFLALVLLANLTTVAPERSWPMTGRLATIILPLLLFFQSHLYAGLRWPAWCRWLPLAMAGVLCLLLLEFWSGGQLLMPLLKKSKPEPLTYYNRGLSYAAVLVWPLLFWMQRSGRRGWAFGLFLLLLATCWFSQSRGAVLALIVAAGFYGLGAVLPRLAIACGVMLLAMVFGVTLLAIPWVVAHHYDWINHLPPSWQHRVEIWDYMLAWQAERPWGGWLGAGLNAAGAIPIGGAHQTLYTHAFVPVAHPHHMPLQLLLELGWGGWFWGLALAGGSLWRLTRQDGNTAALASWAAMIVLSCGAFSLWSDSFWAAGALVWLAVRLLIRSTTAGDLDQSLRTASGG